MSGDVPVSQFEATLNRLGQFVTAAHPGTSVSLDSLRTSLNVSRTTVREALRALEILGVVALQRRAGVVVAPLNEWSLLHPTVIGLRSQGQDQDRQREDFTALAQAIDAAAAAQVPQECAADLSRRVTAMRKAVRRGHHILAAEECRALHVALAVASGNDLFTHLARTAAAYSAGAQRPYCHGSPADHQTLADAIAREQPQAAATASAALYPTH